jgi:type VI secretion system secreted protein Hcp
MDGALRGSIRKLLALTLAVTCLGVGYLVHDVGGSAPGRPVVERVPTKKLTPADLMLAASTASNIHLRYDGVTSGVVDANHLNEIPIDSLQFGVGRAISSPGSGRTVSPPNISEITLSHTTDKYSAKLLNLSLRGTVGAGTSPTAALFLTNMQGPGGTYFDYMRITLQQVLISGFSLSTGGSLPSESISLNFAGVMTFETHLPSGTTQSVTYNVTTQT